MAKASTSGHSGMKSRGYHMIGVYLNQDDLDFVRKAHGKDWKLGNFIAEAALKEIRRSMKRKSNRKT